MEAEVFLKEWHRMCNAFLANVNDSCPLKKRGIVIYCCNCQATVCVRADKAVKIVQEWSDAHPQKTRLSVFLEAFPKASREKNGYPQSCAGYIFGFDCSTRSDDDCMECWNTPVEE